MAASRMYFLAGFDESAGIGLLLHLAHSLVDFRRLRNLFQYLCSVMVDPPGYVGLGYDAAAPSLLIHHQYAPDLMLFEQVNALHNRRVLRYGNASPRHAVRCVHFERIPPLRDGANSNVAIGDNSNRPHRLAVIDNRYLAAVAAHHRVCDFL
jgi:hypothetical protein